jgi:hypothetical protein
MNESLFHGLRPAPVRAALAAFAESDETERGAVYTRIEVVEAMLDLVGYVTDRPLHMLRVVEPSFGDGAFLSVIVDRLLSSFAAHGGSSADVRALEPAVFAVELHRPTFEATFARMVQRLERFGVDSARAQALVQHWLRCDDFLLLPDLPSADLVVGNPPYVRHERVPEVLMAEYRRRYFTIYDRADLYIPFFERGLGLLREGGALAFICANRWLKNKYGRPLRVLAQERFRLVYYIDLEGCPAFTSEVIAYPAITVLRREPPGTTRFACKPALDAPSMQRLTAELTGDGSGLDPRVYEASPVMTPGEPWLFEPEDHSSLLRRLEKRFPTLEEAGCRVGIGVATGLDKVFIGDFEELPVEPERKLPLAMARDLCGHELVWRGKGVLNPFAADGTMVNLDDWPMFAAWLELHRQAVAARHCARRPGSAWFRTIDRIWPDLTSQPKLLIPDIKGEPVVAIDRGEYYPHHNLYFVTSSEWPLEALAAVLRSSIAVFFVASYCVRMSGGFLRFQAQYLRRIRVPQWATLETAVQLALTRVGSSAGTSALELDQEVGRAFGLSEEDLESVREAARRARVRKEGVA